MLDIQYAANIAADFSREVDVPLVSQDPTAAQACQDFLQCNFRQPGIERHERPACFQRAENPDDHRHARLAENGGHARLALRIASAPTRYPVSRVVKLRTSKRAPSRCGREWLSLAARQL